MFYKITTLVAEGGFEPPTQGFSVLCSTELSYSAILIFYYIMFYPSFIILFFNDTKFSSFYPQAIYEISPTKTLKKTSEYRFQKQKK